MEFETGSGYPDIATGYLFRNRVMLHITTSNLSPCGNSISREMPDPCGPQIKLLIADTWQWCSGRSYSKGRHIVHPNCKALNCRYAACQIPMSLLKQCRQDAVLHFEGFTPGDEH